MGRGIETRGGKGRGLNKEAKMKKRCIGLLVILPLLAWVMGCGMSLNQLNAEKAYYQMLSKQAEEKQPLIDIKIADPTKPINIERIIVYAPSTKEKFAQYQHRDFTPAWVPAALNAAAPFGLLYGGSLIIKEVGKVQSAGTATTYNQNVSGSSTASLRTAGSTAVGGNVGAGGIVAGPIDQTSTPTVVNQPTPIIVEQPPAQIIYQPAQ
jgi:hypothetical protein